MSYETTRWPNEWHRTASPSGEIIAQKAEITDAWTQDLKDHDSKDADSVDEDIKIEEKELEIECEQQKD